MKKGVDDPQVTQCNHIGKWVKVGPYQIMAGGTRYLQPEDVAEVELVIPLNEEIVGAMGQLVNVLCCPWQDMSPPPEGFKEFLLERVIPELEAGRKILVHCIGSHGRTGTFLAFLIALLEPDTLDPIKAVRERHCVKAVETLEQASSIFDLRRAKLPRKYVREFARSVVLSGFFAWERPLPKKLLRNNRQIVVVTSLKEKKDGKKS